MTRRARARLLLLWGAFLVVHVVTAALGWVYPSQPMGDVVLVYEPWASAALSGGAVVGVTDTWVYPQLALVPMLAAGLLSTPLVGVLGASTAYLLAWAALMTVLDTVAFATLLGRSPAAPRRAAAWFWTGALLLLGPVGLYRIDAVTVPVVVLAAAWLVSRPALAAALLAVGAWIKIWPGAVLLAAVVAGRARLRMLSAALMVTAGVIATLLLLGAREEVFGFLAEQTGRGLQIEAVAATPFLWMAARGDARIEYSFDILTFQVAAPGADVVAALLTPLMAVVVVGLTVLGLSRARRGASMARLLPPLALALVTALIVTNKVGSPQFQTWLIAPVVLWIVFDRRRAGLPAAMVLGLCLLTWLVYPIGYDALLQAWPLAVVVLSLRNALLIVLLVVAVRAILRAPASRPTPIQE
ncbi:hypothetical protein [Microbacterium sp. 179-I 3D4 NHS]|uniref:hypothetical protein n=1 Tax=Microbacterium sp. 179-I 3D4 NHS TaxID=3142381 RepID=UPI0039A30FF3